MQCTWGCHKDNMNDWIRLEFGESLRAVDDIVGWRRICGAQTTIKVNELKSEALLDQLGIMLEQIVKP